MCDKIVSIKVIKLNMNTLPKFSARLKAPTAVEQMRYRFNIYEV